MINRPSYLAQITPFINAPLIKVITGIRRSGKSTVVKLLQTQVLSQGIDKEKIIYINFESFSFNELKNSQKLYAFVLEKMTSENKYYLLLDEI